MESGVGSELVLPFDGIVLVLEDARDTIAVTPYEEK
jgi:hypothetical protein